jgi:hypothetical protein
MKIYFAGSIRGGRKYAELYRRVISALKEKHQVPIALWPRWNYRTYAANIFKEYGQESEFEETLSKNLQYGSDYNPRGWVRGCHLGDCEPVL